MPRANRIFSAGRVWHITHRCHQRSFLLKFVRDRRRWRHWLFEARRRYGLSVLDYIVTSNHVHLLCADQGNGEIPRSLQLIAGRTAQEFNSRKNRKGAFWEDRYHATAVQTDSHLTRCISYIDLNMVRARAVRHPKEWEVSGYNEIQSPWQRKRIIDFETLMKFLGVKSHEELAALQNRLLDEEIRASRRDPIWTEAVAVGDDNYLQDLKNTLSTRGFHKHITGERDTRALREQDPCYFSSLDLKMSD